MTSSRFNSVETSVYFLLATVHQFGWRSLGPYVCEAINWGWLW